jgi:ankyrin repeat domain-containing protein 50
LTVGQWSDKVNHEESNRILAEICMWRLSLSGFNLRSFHASEERRQYIAKRTFLGYSAQFWADHFREGNWNSEDWAIKNAASYFGRDLATAVWFEIYSMVSTRVVPDNFTPLLVASYFGLSKVVERLPPVVFADVNVKDSRHERTAVSWAAGNGHEDMVQQLLNSGAVIDTTDKDGWTPLYWAAGKAHAAV